MKAIPWLLSEASFPEPLCWLDAHEHLPRASNHLSVNQTRHSWHQLYQSRVTKSTNKRAGYDEKALSSARKRQLTPDTTGSC